jgi:tetratricopeptide (TPR) repeat protein
MSNYEEAIKCYDVSINYGYWTAHYNRGIIFAATNRYDDAIYDFDRVIQLEHSQLIIDRAIEEKLRVYKILGKPTDKLCNDEQKHARKEKNVPDMLFSQKKIEAPSRLSIKRAFELSHIHFMTAQNTLSPPIGNRIIIGGIGGSIYSLVLSLELFLKGCRLYYDDKWILSHDIKKLTDGLLEASNNSKNYKLQLNKDTLDEIQKLTNLEVRYNNFRSWHKIHRFMVSNSYGNITSSTKIFI